MWPDGNSIRPGSSIGPQPWLNFGNSGPSAMMLQSILEPMLRGQAQQFMGGNGGFGQLFPQQSYWEFNRRQEEFARQQEAMRAMAERDAQSLARMARNTALLGGATWTPQAQAAAEAAARATVSLVPSDPRFARAFDTATGGRGASLFAANMFSAGRYMVDPLTGQMGLSTDTLSAYNQGMFQNMFGPGQDFQTRLRGFGAGETSQLLDQLARRGALPSVVTESDMNFAADTPASTRASRLRGANMQRITQALERRAGSLEAMKDLLAVSGEVDASMERIVESLEAMTQGRWVSMDGNRLESQIRGVRNAMQAGGWSAQQVRGIMARGGALYSAAGLSSSQGVATASHVMNAVLAYGTSSHEDSRQAGNAQFGETYQDRLADHASSSFGNLAGAMFRLDKAGLIGANTPAAQLMDTLRNPSPNASITLGDGRRIRLSELSEEGFVDILSRSGMSRAVAHQYARHYRENARALSTEDNARLMSVTQPQEARDMMTQVASDAIRDLDLGGRDQAQVAQDVVAAALAGNGAATPERLAAALVRRGYSRDLAGNLSSLFLGNLPEADGRIMAKYDFKPENLINQMSENFVRQQQRLQAQQAAQGQQQAAQAGMGTGGPWSRVADWLNSVLPDDARTVAGINVGDTARSFIGAITNWVRPPGAAGDPPTAGTSTVNSSTKSLTVTLQSGTLQLNADGVKINGEGVGTINVGGG